VRKVRVYAISIDLCHGDMIPHRKCFQFSTYHSHLTDVLAHSYILGAAKAMKASRRCPKSRWSLERRRSKPGSTSTTVTVLRCRYISDDDMLRITL